MKLTKIKIENFKSIKLLEFDIKKYGGSYTTMFLGVNESGKSNILEAMSFIDTPEGEFNYYTYHNQKDDDNNLVNLWFYLTFDKKATCVNFFKDEIEGGDLLSFEVTDIVKNIYLRHEETVFNESYDYNIKVLSKNLFISSTGANITNETGQQIPTTYRVSKSKEDDTFEELTDEKLRSYFADRIEEAIRTYEPSSTFWKPSPEYLISTEDLNDFTREVPIKPALKNIFLLAGYHEQEAIKTVVSTINDGHQRSRLKGKLEDSLNKYLGNVWQHNIDVVIDITETGQFTLSIKDTGDENKHDRLPINCRSEGARQFLSLVLSLSIESKYKKRKNQLILIDEPEAHLHPSGIRDLSKELLNIGKNNYLFLSTHSPFLVDKKRKERHIIIKKNKCAFTEKTYIDNNTSIIDDEVLREAFGLEVYRDLLNPHSILVEGASDKMLLQKVLVLKGKPTFGITNGHGSNIDILASKLNDVGMSVCVLVDDDSDGKMYKNKILRVGGSYSEKNVFTIRDLVGDIVADGTIEDTLGKNYVESRFKKLYGTYYSEKDCNIDLDEMHPFVIQMKGYLYKNKKSDIDMFMEKLKYQLAEDFKPAKASFSKNFPLLNKLVEEVIKKLE